VISESVRYNIEKLVNLAAIMASENNIALTITFIDSELTSEELNDEAVRLLEELSDRNDIESADRVRDPNPPDGNKSIGGFLTGLLKTDVSPANAIKVLGDPNPPDGNKSIGGFLTGLLKADVSPANAMKVLGFLGDRLGSKPISVEAEVDGVKMKFSAYSQEEATFAMDKIQAFIDKNKKG